ncbi:TPA: YcgL domain-containing protein [Escherichia coli]
MFCVIYRSSKRDQTYLYVKKKDDFSRVPEELMKGFGQPQLAMILPLDGRKKLVNADIEKVKQALTEQGYYLQLPPPPEDLLKQHLSVMGQKTDDTNK